MKVIRQKQDVVYSILALLILLFSISTITQAWYPFSVNRVLTFGIVICLGVIFLLDTNGYDVLLMCGLGGCFVFSCLTASNIRKNVNDYIYFFTAVLFLRVITKEIQREKLIDAFRKNGKLLEFVTYGCVGLILISLFFDSSYSYIWGDTTRYFCGFAGGAHVIASSTCLIMALLTFTNIKKRFRISVVVLLLLLGYTILMTGARTFIVSSALILAVYLSNYSIGGFIRRRKYGKYIIAGVLALSLIAFFTSPIVDKLISLDMGKSKDSVIELINRFTNGRISIWSCLIDGYAQEKTVNKLFGCGFGRVYAITKATLGSELWSHNDFIHLLVGTGIFGLMLYLGVLCDLFKKLSQKNRVIYTWATIIYLLFPAIMNGFCFTYFHLFLSFIVLTLCGDSLTWKMEIKDIE